MTKVLRLSLQTAKKTETHRLLVKESKLPAMGLQHWVFLKNASNLCRRPSHDSSNKLRRALPIQYGHPRTDWSSSKSSTKREKLSNRSRTAFSGRASHSGSFSTISPRRGSRLSPTARGTSGCEGTTQNLRGKPRSSGEVERKMEKLCSPRRVRPPPSRGSSPSPPRTLHGKLENQVWKSG